MINKKNIITTKNGEYIIRKTINGVKEYYGTYNSLDTALIVRDKLMNDDWSKKNLSHIKIMAEVHHLNNKCLLQYYPYEVVDKLYQIQKWTNCSISIDEHTGVIYLAYDYIPWYIMIYGIRESIKPELNVVNVYYTKSEGAIILLQPVE